MEGAVGFVVRGGMKAHSLPIAALKSAIVSSVIATAQRPWPLRVVKLRAIMATTGERYSQTSPD